MFSSRQNLVRGAQFIDHGAFSGVHGSQNQLRNTRGMPDKAYNLLTQLYFEIASVIANLNFSTKTCNAVEEQKYIEISELSSPIKNLDETELLHIFLCVKKKHETLKTIFRIPGDLGSRRLLYFRSKSPFSRWEVWDFAGFEFQRSMFFFNAQKVIKF